MLVLSRADVEAVLDLDRLVDAVAGAMVELSCGRTSMPPRVAAMVPDHDGLLAAMPASLPSAGALTTKLVSLFPANRDRPTHQALIVCFDPDNGTPLAVMDGTLITEARTAAGSALATRLLASAPPRVVSVIGAGAQARAHTLALARLDSVEMIQLAGRDPAKAAGLAGRLARELAGRGIAVTAVDSIEAAVRSADVVCVATHASEPIVLKRWLRPGTHTNSVGYNTAGAGEIDGELIHDALVVVESRAAALAPPPAGAVELRRAIDAGVITAEDIHAELGELVAGTVAGRTDDEQLTVYKSVGVAVQDAAAAGLVLDEARRRGVGRDLEM